MNKKLLLIVLSILLIVTLTGCGTKKTVDTPVESNALSEDEVEIHGVKYKLDQNETGYGINYKIASNFRKVDTGNALNYHGEKDADGNQYFVIRIFHYTNKTIDYAIKDTTTEYDSKTEVDVDGLTYTKVHFTNFNGANTYIFYYKNNKDVYAYCFTANEEETRLEYIFLSQIDYGENK